MALQISYILKSYVVQIVFKIVIDLRKHGSFQHKFNTQISYNSLNIKSAKTYTLAIKIQHIRNGILETILKQIFLLSMLKFRELH